MPGTTWNVMTESLELLQTAAMMISDTNTKAPTPCADWTVTQVLQHAAGDQLAWSAALGVGSGPAENPFAPSGHLDGQRRRPPHPGSRRGPHRLGRHRPRSASGTDAAAAGRVARRVAAAACALDAAVHAWDIAAALGQPGFLPDELAAQLLPGPDHHRAAAAVRGLRRRAGPAAG